MAERDRLAEALRVSFDLDGVREKRNYELLCYDVMSPDVGGG